MTKIIDTKTIQIRSLLRFMSELGWVSCQHKHPVKGFVLYAKTNRYLSFEDAIKLHNGVFDNPLSRTLSGKLCLSNSQADIIDIETYMMIQQTDKYVKKVKLQRNKNSPDGFECQSNLVRLTDLGKEIYGYMFTFETVEPASKTTSTFPSTSIQTVKDLLPEDTEFVVTNSGYEVNGIYGDFIVQTEDGVVELLNAMKVLDKYAGE